MDIAFTGGAVQAMIMSAVLCFIVPLIFLGYYKAKKDVKLSSFFIGIAFSFLFTFVGRSVLDWVFLLGFGLGNLLNLANHPVYVAVYSAVLSGFLAQIGSYIALKYCMKSRPGKENAFLLGLGKGGFECMIYGGIANIANVIMALLINAFGVEDYFARLGIPAEEAAAQQSAIAAQAAIPASSILSDGTLQFLAMWLNVALTILVYVALTNKDCFYYLPAAILLQIIGYVPIYLSQVGVLTSLTITMGITVGYIFAILVLVYRLYQSEKVK
ncbi:MAG: YhfC family intramembrane metalloprotease [Lachnospiraceae bacterium]|nr:YhfC family intramembrane metalloprotease [Lachnospiraceae bacterium]